MGWNYAGYTPYDFYRGSAVVLNGEIHILGGYGNGTKHRKYSNGQWTSVSTLPYDFYDGSAVVLNDEIHILGGYNNGTNHYKYSNNQWVEVSTLPYNFYRGSAVVLNGEIHILGGSGNNIKHYKYSNGQWTSVSTLPYYFYNGSAVVLNGEIHILGSDSISLHYKYSNNQWVEVSTLPYNFYRGSAVVLNGEIHILGGSNNNTKHYKYSNGQWTSVSTLPYSFYYGSAVVLNNEIHILGSGFSNDNSKYYKMIFSRLTNKIIYGNEIVLDLTKDTVTPETLVNTATAHDAAGNRILGDLSITDRTPSTASYSLLPINSVNRILTRTGYLYGNRPCGRNLFSTSGTASRTTSWTPVEFGSSVYEEDGSSYGVMLDPWFGHIDANGDIVVDRAIPTAYIHGCAFRGVTSSGTAVYSGIRLLKNGTVIEQLYGSSSTTSPSCRRIETSFAVGDVIQIQTRCSTTTQGYARCEMGITWAGT